MSFPGRKNQVYFVFIPSILFHMYVSYIYCTFLGKHLGFYSIGVYMLRGILSSCYRNFYYFRCPPVSTPNKGKKGISILLLLFPLLFHLSFLHQHRGLQNYYQRCSDSETMQCIIFLQKHIFRVISVFQEACNLIHSAASV